MTFDFEPGLCHLTGGIDHRAAVQGLERRVDFAKPLVDVIKRLLRLCILGFQAVVFVAQRFARRTLVVGQVDGRARQLPQPLQMAVGEVHGDLDPLPPPGGDGLGHGLELLADEASRTGSCSQPAPACAAQIRCLVFFSS